MDLQPGARSRTLHGVPSDATKLKGALRAWSERVARDALGERGMLGHARQDAPRDSGVLARSIRERPFHAGFDRFSGGLEAPVIQAVTTDKGARPHVIRPKRPGGVLRFPSGGAIVYTRRVLHPGNRPQRWWQPMHRRHWPNALRAAARRHSL